MQHRRRHHVPSTAATTNTINITNLKMIVTPTNLTIPLAPVVRFEPTLNNTRVYRTGRNDHIYRANPVYAPNASDVSVVLPYPTLRHAAHGARTNG